MEKNGGRRGTVVRQLACCVRVANGNGAPAPCSNVGPTSQLRSGSSPERSYSTPSSHRTGHANRAPSSNATVPASLPDHLLSSFKHVAASTWVMSAPRDDPPGSPARALPGVHHQQGLTECYGHRERYPPQHVVRWERGRMVVGHAARYCHCPDYTRSSARRGGRWVARFACWPSGGLCPHPAHRGGTVC
jgi:hypothetical protein